MDARVTKTGPGIEKLKQDLANLVNTDVLVGISEDSSTRQEGAMTNAQLMFVHTNGSPLQNIPARPVIEPAIQAEGNNEQISDQLGKAAEAALKYDPVGALRHLRLAGQVAENASKAWFVDPRNNWPPNKPETIARKVRKMSKQQLDEKLKTGEKLTRPLIDTGQLRKSILHIVRERKND